MVVLTTVKTLTISTITIWQLQATCTYSENSWMKKRYLWHKSTSLSAGSTLAAIQRTTYLKPLTTKNNSTVTTSKSRSMPRSSFKLTRGVDRHKWKKLSTTCKAIQWCLITWSSHISVSKHKLIQWLKAFHLRAMSFKTLVHQGR